MSTRSADADAGASGARAGIAGEDTVFGEPPSASLCATTVTVYECPLVRPRNVTDGERGSWTALPRSGAGETVAV